jgi:hypothetical protein
MPVPWDALLPFGLIYGLFYVGFHAVDWLHRVDHNMKVSLWSKFDVHI